ncbi:hypothetical protein Scep_017634 [Stephania cephalantha]|uniref:CLAVATA3/ESR (CLE)-related protein 25 n=1 Tax=Stephania cephalantha TaxID=152367 RepID=A0AAP0IPW5_9MAGN
MAAAGCGRLSKNFVLLFIWFLLVIGTIASQGAKRRIPTSRPGNLKRLDVVGRDAPVIHSDLDPNYMSKRRVPNGPDPIHNRRAGKSGQPAGRA